MAGDRSGQRIRGWSAARWYLALTLLSLIVLAPIYFLFVRAISDPSKACQAVWTNPAGLSAGWEA